MSLPPLNISISLTSDPRFQSQEKFRFLLEAELSDFLITVQHISAGILELPVLRRLAYVVGHLQRFRNDHLKWRIEMCFHLGTLTIHDNGERNFLFTSLARIALPTRIAIRPLILPLLVSQKTSQ